MPGLSFMRDAAYLAIDDLVEQFVVGVEMASTETAQRVTALAEAMEKGLGGVGSKLEEAHTAIAREAQQATVEAYEAAVSVRNTPAYRTTARRPGNVRYAGGLLLSALADPSFAVATADGILFANTALMDSRARQWARLNFGAGGAGSSGGGPRTFEVRMSDVVVAAIGIEGDVRPAFVLPRGWWRDDQFFPVGEKPTGSGRWGRPFDPRNTRGIVAQGWLNAGMETIANLLPNAYLNIFDELYREAKATAGQITGATIRTPIPSGHVGSSVTG